MSVEQLVIVHLEHTDTRVTEEIAQSIKREVALRSNEVRITSCHLKYGAMVVGCTNTLTKVWLEKQFQELNLLQGFRLRIGLTRSLVKMVKILKSTGPEEKERFDA